ncbi:MAG: bifunctional methylenetetrahydrofolate dehydrogenase/methenyltetrahydrofolate cyclohydrolase FolD [Acidobacteriota bacterium]
MTARILDGAGLARVLRAEVAAEVRDLAAAGRPVPGLAVILAGEDPASAVYVRNKSRACVEAGIHSTVETLDAGVTTSQLLDRVASLNDAEDVDGILVQLPLPGEVDTDRILASVDPEKDVDGFHVVNAGALAQGHPRLVPCTPAGIMELLRREKIETEGARAVVLGRSTIVGRPMALLLVDAHATVTVAHSRTRDLPALCREADILVAAVGRPGLVTDEFIRPGATVIDVGINRVTEEARVRDLVGPGSPRLAAWKKRGWLLVGDVHPSRAVAVAGALTPVPGGVGPLTVAMLLKNTLGAYRGRRAVAGEA